MPILSTQARVIKRIDHTDRYLTFQMELPAGQAMLFKAGQFVSIVVDKGVRRSYSIASSPIDSSLLEFHIDLAPGGKGSQFFSQLMVDDKVQMMGPLGRFMQEAPGNDCVMFATGTGIAPFCSYLSTYLPVTTNSYHLKVGFRYEQDIYCLEWLTKMSELFPQLKLDIYLSRPGDDWEGITGRINSEISSDEVSDKLIYICGSQQMISDTTDKLKALGVGSDRIKYEEYY